MEEDICQGFLRSFNTQLLSISYEPVNFLSTGGKKTGSKTEKFCGLQKRILNFEESELVLMQLIALGRLLYYR